MYSNLVFLFYFSRDKPNVDIVGSNIYKRYIEHCSNNNMPEENGNINDQTTGTYTTPKSRIIPSSAKFHKQTVQNIEGLLVSTGVYNPTQSKKKDNGDHSHRDFDVDSDLPIPSKYVEDIDCAITYALQKENYELVCY